MNVQNKPKTNFEPIENYGLSKRSRKRSLFSKIGVIGAGREGSVIVTTAALKGLEVVFLEPSEDKIKNAFYRIEEKLTKKMDNWGLTENEYRATLGRIRGTSDYGDFADCDFVIEAIRYDQNGIREVTQRKEVFRRLEEVLSPTAIIATNASTAIVTDLSGELENKERCIGLHFLSNVPESQIIEIVRALYTSDETFDKVCLFARLINHEFVVVEESAGLASIRLFLIQLNEACFILSESISNVEDIDKILTVGFGHHQGVFRTADEMGLEKIVSLLNSLHEEYGHQKYKPSPILLKLVRAKHIGVSVGQGFYKYDESGNIIK